MKDTINGLSVTLFVLRWHINASGKNSPYARTCWSHDTVGSLYSPIRCPMEVAPLLAANMRTFNTDSTDTVCPASVLLAHNSC